MPFPGEAAVHRSRLPVLTYLVLTAGCYSYVAVDLDSVAMGETVRASLSAGGVREFTAVSGVPVVSLQGQLLERSDDEILLFVPTITRQIGFHFETMSQRVLIAREEIFALEKRRLDRGRTAVLIGVLGVAVGIAAFEIISGRSGASNTPPFGDVGPSDSRGGPPGDILLPLVRLRLR